MHAQRIRAMHTRAACAHATGSRRARTLVFHLKAGCRPLTFSVRHAGARVQRTKVWQNKCIQRCARGRIRTWAHQRWPLGMRPWPPFSCAPCAWHRAPGRTKCRDAPWQNKVHTEMRPWPTKYKDAPVAHQVQMYQSFFLLYSDTDRSTTGSNPGVSKLFVFFFTVMLTVDVMPTPSVYFDFLILPLGLHCL